MEMRGGELADYCGGFDMCVGGVEVHTVLCEALAIYMTSQEYSFRPDHLLLLAVHFFLVIAIM